MTIKKQFSLLAGVIIIIPLLCVLYILIHNYIHSPARLVLEGSRELEINSLELAKDDKTKVSKLLKNVPPGTDFILLDEDYSIILTNFPQYQAGTNIPPEILWTQLRGSSDKYFYQTTTASSQKTNYILISRVRKGKRHEPSKPHTWFTPMIFILIIVVCICIILIILIFRDISKSIINLKKQTEAIAGGDLSEKIECSDLTSNEITSISESLEIMRKSLVEAQNQKNKFIMGISHDLRTPVAVIKGYTEALSDGVISEPQEISNTLDLILSKSSQLESMIDTLINFMKLNTNDVRQNLIPNSITAFITNFTKEAEITANVFKRKFNHELKFDRPIFIKFDKQLVTRVFENLYNNALRYTKENDSITFKSWIDEDNLYFSISDTGCGIEKEDLDNIFNLFYRGTNSRREEGMGIGLSVVKNIIEIHGWHVSVESEKNKGSCFTITIPILPENDLEIGYPVD